MFTVCPKCTLTLVVTTVDLRAGQGLRALWTLRQRVQRAHRTARGRARRLDLRQRATPAESKPFLRHPQNPHLGSGVAVEPEPEPVPEPEPDPEPEPHLDTEAGNRHSRRTDAEEPIAEEIELSAEPPAEPEEGSLEFDATATDVSEIFISPSQAEHDTGSGNYEAVVLAEDPQPEYAPASADAEEAAPEPDEPSHTDTIAADDWSLLDDDEPPADAESIIEESPLAQEAEPDPEPEPDSTSEISANDPTWVQDMFAEAEAEALRTRTSERQILHPVEDDDEDEPAVVKAARDVEGVSATSGDTALEPLLNARSARYPTWVYASGIGLLAFLLFAQLMHYNRHGLVLNASVGPLVSSVYGWFGATLTPRWDLSAYTVKQLGAEAEGNEGSRLRVRLSVQNDSDRVQPLPLLRLTLQDRFGKAVATRDLEPGGISAAARRRTAPARTRSTHRRRIARDRSRQEPRAPSRSMPACAPKTAGSAVPTRRGDARPAEGGILVRIGPYELSSPVVLAPMAGVTDRPFRQLAREFGAGLAASEMITSDVRLWSTRKTRARMDHTGEPEPRVVQLAGADPEALAEAARRNIDLGAQIIDINMGCPAKKVCNRLCGSALLTDEVARGPHPGTSGACFERAGHLEDTHRLSS